MVTPIVQIQETNHLQSSETARDFRSSQPISDSIQLRESSCLETIIESVINFFKYIFCCHQDESEGRIPGYELFSDGAVIEQAGFVTFYSRPLTAIIMGLSFALTGGRDPHVRETVAAFEMFLGELVEQAYPDINIRIGQIISSRDNVQYYSVAIVSPGDEYNIFDRISNEQRAVIEEHWELRFDRDVEASINKHIFTTRLTNEGRNG